MASVLRRQRAAVERAERDRRAREEGLREANRRLEQEIHEHRRTEDRLRFAMRELDHRVKNTLATVQAVADQTLHSSADMREFADAFTGRLQAMARIHGALAQRRWEGLTLTDLVELVVGPYRHHAESVLIACDGTFVGSELVRVLGMALHELATNAAKYGALSTARGHVSITSRLDDDGGRRACTSPGTSAAARPCATPARRGFGMRLIEEALAYETDGRVALRFPERGPALRDRDPGPGVMTRTGMRLAPVGFPRAAAPALDAGSAAPRLAEAHDAVSPDPNQGLDRLFLDRVRLGLRLVLAGIAVVFVGWLVRCTPGERPLINVVQAINFLVVAVALHLLRDPPRAALTTPSPSPHMPTPSSRPGRRVSSPGTRPAA